MLGHVAEKILWQALHCHNRLFSFAHRNLLGTTANLKWPDEGGARVAIINSSSSQENL